MYSSKLDSAKFGKYLALSTLFLISPLSFSATSEQQRRDYQDAITAIKSKDIVRFQALKKELKDYPLYPYLAYREILPRLKKLSYKEVANFEYKYADLPFTNMLRNKYLYTLAQQGKWKDYIRYQRKEPFSQVNQCNFYYAHSKVGNKRIALKGAKKLYLSGSSIASACDKLFRFMKKEKALDDALIMKRMLLVFERGNRRLLQYLSKELSSKNKNLASQILSYYYNPEKILKIKKNQRKTSYQRQLYYQAFKRLGRFDHEKAIANFDAIARSLNLSKGQKQAIAEYIASRIMSTTEPKLAKWRDKWLSQSKDQNLLDRRFRIALVANDWKDKARWINLIPKEVQKKPKWQYWQARLLINKGQTQEAEGILRGILGKRDFYSVAAAIYLNEDISIPVKHSEPAYDKLKSFEQTLARIGELEALNKTSASKSEWRNMLKKASREQKAGLAAYALEKSWYAHSVQATISGKLWEHLEYRFPVAHRWFFEQFSRENNVPITTLLALSRQESAFYTRAVSPVGARGLMQLMPATAKETSSKLGLSYSGVETLTDPGINIRIGSGYLRMLLDKFEQNRILAYAAYNAGPSRVNSWLARSQGNLDVIAFIEGIPFYETRGYVQNVLMYEVYYRKLLGMPLQFLQEQELAFNY